MLRMTSTLTVRDYVCCSVNPVEFDDDLEQTLAGLHTVSLVAPQAEVCLADTAFAPAAFDQVFDRSFFCRALTAHLQVGVLLPAPRG